MHSEPWPPLAGSDALPEWIMTSSRKVLPRLRLHQCTWMPGLLFPRGLVCVKQGYYVPLILRTPQIYEVPKPSFTTRARARRHWSPGPSVDDPWIVASFHTSLGTRPSEGGLVAQFVPSVGATHPVMGGTEFPSISLPSLGSLPFL